MVNSELEAKIPTTRIEEDSDEKKAKSIAVLLHGSVKTFGSLKQKGDYLRKCHDRPNGRARIR